MPQNDSEQGTPDLLSSNKDLSSSTSVASSSPNVRVLDYSDVIQNMDEANGDSNTPNGTLLGAYPGQNVGDHVSTGTHVHCNRFNGPKSDHRYWSHSVLKDLLTLQAVTVIGILPNMGVMSIPWDVVTDSIIKIKEFMIALHGRVDYSIQTGPKLPGTDNIAFPISQQKGIKCEALLVYPL